MSRPMMGSDFQGTSIPSPAVGLLDPSSGAASPRPSQSERGFSPVTGVHPAVVKIALSAVVWFLAVAWLDFSGGPEVDLVRAVVTGFFIMFFTTFLLAASMVIDDPRWKQPKPRFTQFLKDEVPHRRGNDAGSGCPDPHRVAAGVFWPLPQHSLASSGQPSTCKPNPRALRTA
jgi:hypothetical protein